MFFGKLPKTTGVLLVFWMNEEVLAVIVRGAPEVQLKIPPNCHCSTSRVSQPGPLVRKGRPGPNGNSYDPLLRIECERWNSTRVLLRARCRGFKYIVLPSSEFSPKVLLHVYDV